jgi:hypothetical protein
MTMLMTMIRPEGVWQSADNRVTINGRVQDDVAPKQLHIICPPLPGGPQLLLAFTGLAVLCDGTPTIRWVRETLRGEPRQIMQMLEFLRGRLTRDVGRSGLWRNPLIFSGGIFEGDKRYYVELRNVDPRTRQAKRAFDFVVREVMEPAIFVGGSGFVAIFEDDWTLLKSQAQIRPAKWEDHSGLLAAVNRRAAANDRAKSVSPWCSTTYISHDQDGAHQKRYARPGEPQGPAGIETMLSGLDLFELSASAMQQWERMKRGESVEEEEPDKPDQTAVTGRP